MSAFEDAMWGRMARNATRGVIWFIGLPFVAIIVGGGSNWVRKQHGDFPANVLLVVFGLGGLVGSVLWLLHRRD